ncbi:MAG: hypothetical protein IJK67_05285 [Bacilli bacterium]|nr:hypothetical protein [Bacilli bacterium]
MRKSINNLFNINPKFSTTAAFVIGLILIDDLTAAEQNAVGEWLILLGQTLITNSGLQMVIENKINNNTININSKELKSIYNPTIYDINKTKDLLNKLYPTYKNEFASLLKMIKKLEKEINNIKKE